MLKWYGQPWNTNSSIMVWHGPVEACHMWLIVEYTQQCHGKARASGGMPHVVNRGIQTAVSKARDGISVRKGECTQKSKPASLFHSITRNHLSKINLYLTVHEHPT
ncbi:unnamed protein product [Ectocarpus sp. 12 AP-2014]